MSALGSAIGAVIAAMLESSVLSNLAVDLLKPDLVFAVGIAVAVVLGFESAMAWAVTGGIMLDILMPERALGVTSLALLLVTGLALVLARVTGPPRLPAVMLLAFLLGLLFQVLMLILLALTSGIAATDVSPAGLAGIAVLDAVVAAIAVVILRALDQRFGDLERADW
jgi:rod shape-determining protein MreD